MLDVYAITHRTRPDSVKVYSKTARAQVTRLVAALAHHEADNDDISRARVSEAQAGLVRVMELDEAVRNFRAELDKSLRVMQDSVYKLQDDLQRMTPQGLTYTVSQPKGTTHVGSQGQAKLPQSTSPAGISASGDSPTVGAVRPYSAGAGQPTGTAPSSTR